MFIHWINTSALVQVSLGSLELWQLQADAHWAIAQPSMALNPNTNLVKIHGIRNGAGGITLGAKASNQGNMTNAPFPVGKAAMFYILRR